MTPQQLHDIWLVLTVISTLEISAIAIYLLRMFRSSSRKWFFWSIGFVLASVAVEHACAELKNLGQAPPPDFNIALMWLLGRVQEAIVAGLVLGYMVFGRNGKPVAPVIASVPPDTPKES